MPKIRQLTHPSPSESRFYFPQCPFPPSQPSPTHPFPPSTASPRQPQTPGTDNYPCVVACATLYRYVPYHCATTSSIHRRPRCHSPQPEVGRSARGPLRARLKQRVHWNGWPARKDPPTAEVCRPCQTWCVGRGKRFFALFLFFVIARPAFDNYGALVRLPLSVCRADDVPSWV